MPIENGNTGVAVAVRELAQGPRCRSCLARMEWGRGVGDHQKWSSPEWPPPWRRCSWCTFRAQVSRTLY